MANAFGLSRDDFTEPLKRQLRQECGFGCVLCGDALYEYAHVDPPFREARTHDVAGMALLCPRDHKALDRYARISPAEVMKARLNPRAKQLGFARDHFCLGDTEPVVMIGSLFFADCRKILSIEGSDLLLLDPPEEPGGPWRLSATFCADDGSLLATISQNEVRAQSATWDIEVVGPKMTFRDGPGSVSLVLVTLPSHGIRVERLDMTWAGTRVSVDGDNVVTVGTCESSTFTGNRTLFQGCASCICVSEGVLQLGDRRAG